MKLLEIIRKDLQHSLNACGPITFQHIMVSIADEVLRDLVTSTSDDPKDLFFYYLPESQQPDSTSEHVYALLNRLQSLGLSQDELKLQINPGNFWKLCESNISHKTENLEQFINMLEPTEAKNKLFTATCPNGFNVFSHTLNYQQTIKPIVLSFLSYLPSPEVIYTTLLQAPNQSVFLHCLETQNFEDCSFLLKIIGILLSPQQQYELFSYNTQYIHKDIFQCTLKEFPAFVPEFCAHLEANPELKQLVLTDCRREDFSEMESMSEGALAAFLNLLKTMPSRILGPILFEKYECNLLEQSLYCQTHQNIILDFMAHCPPEIAFLLLRTEHTIRLAAKNSSDVFLNILERLGHYSAETQVAILSEDKELFCIDSVENLMILLDFVAQMPPQHHFQLLGCFKWNNILNGNPAYCNAFFDWFSQKTADYRKVLLEKNALSCAVFSKNPEIIDRVIQQVQLLNPADQETLLQAFNESVGLRFAFEPVHQKIIEHVRAALTIRPSSNPNHAFFQEMATSASQQAPQPR